MLDKNYDKLRYKSNFIRFQGYKNQHSNSIHVRI